LFQTMIAAAGLDMMRRNLLGLDTEPRYFLQRSGDRPRRVDPK
jgi:nicotinamide-nucleotide amidase